MKSPPDPPALLARLNTLSDMARVRVLRLLDQNELAVGELARSLQLPQSTVSRHLKVLHDGGWITKRTEGTASLYRLVHDTLDTHALDLWRMAAEQLGPHPTFDEDEARLNEVLSERLADSRSFFGRLGARWDELRGELFGTRFPAESLVSLIQRDWIAADLGCGTGSATVLLAPHVRRIVAVDREQTMIDAAKIRLKGRDNVEFRQGDLTALPLEDQAFDIATIYLVLHHVEHPVEAIREAARVLRRNGRLIIVDMVAHDRELYRQTMGHQHLGFKQTEIVEWAEIAGFHDPMYHRLPPDMSTTGPGLFVATMRR